MNSKTLMSLGAAALVGVLAAVALRSDPASSNGIGAGGSPFLPGLRERVNDVASMELVAGDEHFVIARAGEGWGLDAWGGYPADFSQVAATAMALVNLEAEQAKTARPENHASLQVEAPGPGAESLGLTLRDGQGAVLADVVVGRAKGERSLFARRAGEDQAWQVRGKLAPPREPSGWVNKELLRIQANSVDGVTVEHAGAEPLVAKRDDAGQLAVLGLPEGRELMTPSPTTALAGALSYLDLEAVLPTDELPGDLDWWTTRFSCKDGLVVSVASADLDGRTLARFSFEALPAPPTDLTAGEETQDELDDPLPEPAAAPVRDEAALAARVAELSARLSPWTFVLPSWKGSALRKSWDDVLMPLPQVGPALPDEAALLEPEDGGSLLDPAAVPLEDSADEPTPPPDDGQPAQP